MPRREFSSLEGPGRRSGSDLLAERGGLGRVAESVQLPRMCPPHLHPEFHPLEPRLAARFHVGEPVVAYGQRPVPEPPDRLDLLGRRRPACVRAATRRSGITPAQHGCPRSSASSSGGPLWILAETSSSGSRSTNVARSSRSLAWMVTLLRSIAARRGRPAALEQADAFIRSRKCAATASQRCDEVRHRGDVALRDAHGATSPIWSRRSWTAFRLFPKSPHSRRARTD